MAITKQTRIERIEIYPDTGHIGVLMKKEVVDGDVVILSDNHRTMIAPDGPGWQAQMADVNNHLAEMGFPAVEEKYLDVLNAYAGTSDDKAVQAVRAEAEAIQAVRAEAQAVRSEQ